MEETKVQFDTAKLAKEKLFNLKVDSYYTLFHKQLITVNNKLDFNSFVVTKEATYHSSSYSAPTQSLLQKWLREIHQIQIQIHYCGDKFPTVEKDYDAYYPIINDECGNIVDTYEEALEEALEKALNKIK